MPNTTNWAIPYADLNDAPNGPAQELALAVAVDTALTKVNSRPLTVLTRTSQALISNSTATAIPFETELVDDTGMFNVSTNPTQAVATVAGWYLCCGGYSWAANTAGSRVAAFLVNGAEVGREEVPANSAAGRGVSHSLVAHIKLAVGDSVALEAFETSGTNLNLAAVRMSLELMHS